VGDEMGDFQIKKQDFVNKTFRLPVDLVDEMSEIAQKKNISLTQMVIRCCEYALNHLDRTEDDAGE
jgi:hypothetical protein